MNSVSYKDGNGEGEYFHATQICYYITKVYSNQRDGEQSNNKLNLMFSSF